jgi:hypothetical protein
MAVHDDQVNQLLQRYGQALSAGDLAGIASCWEVPALVLADDGTVAVSDTRQLRSFFAQVIGWYRSRGLMATKPQLARAVALTERLTLVEVWWPSFDQAGIQRYSERSYYILRLGNDGQHRIQAAVTEPLSHPEDPVGTLHEGSC